MIFRASLFLVCAGACGGSSLGWRQMWCSLCPEEASPASCRTSVRVSPWPCLSRYHQFNPASGFATGPGASHHPLESCSNTESQLEFPELDGTVSKHSVLASSHILFCSEYCSKSCRFDSSLKFFTDLKQILSASLKRAGNVASAPELTVLLDMGTVYFSWPPRNLGSSE